jgi:hypothetical protein
MSKKQIRYNADQLLADPSKYPQVELNYVLKSKKVILGKIQSVSEERITIRNTFGRKVIIQKNEIREIWGDEVVSLS